MFLACIGSFAIFRISRAYADDAEPPRKASPGFSVLGTMGLFPTQVPTLSYGGWITPEHVPAKVEQHRLTIQVPIYHDEKDTYAISAGGESLHFGEEQTLPASNVVVPEDLWKLEFGGAYSHKLENEKMIGGRISVGSASNRPFADFDVTTVGASAYYSWSTSDQSRWFITAFFSNNNPIINYAPIPGFLYLYQTKTFVGMFGFPFSSIIWRPNESWTYTFSFFGPTVNSEIGYGNPKKFQAFTGFSYSQQSYIPVVRPDPNDRLYYAEMHAPLGIRFPIINGVLTEFSGGYAFDRSIFEGTGFGHQQEGSTKLGNSWFAAWNLRLIL